MTIKYKWGTVINQELIKAVYSWQNSGPYLIKYTCTWSSTGVLASFCVFVGVRGNGINLPSKLSSSFLLDQIQSGFAEILEQPPEVTWWQRNDITVLDSVSMSVPYRMSRYPFFSHLTNYIDISSMI